MGSRHKFRGGDQKTCGETHEEMKKCADIVAPFHFTSWEVFDKVLEPLFLTNRI